MTQTELGWRKHFAWWPIQTETGDMRMFCTVERRWLELPPIGGAFEGDSLSRWVYRDVPDYDE